MAKKKRYNTTPQETFFKWLYFGIFLLIAGWLLSAMFFQKAPLELFKAEVVENPIDSIPYDTIATNLVKLEARVKDLESRLAICMGDKKYKKAYISIESSSVNLRNGPSLSSDILLQIPDRSLVQILFYDKEIYVLEGKNGQWCRIIYAETEGWVWGNFLVPVE